MKKYIHFVFFLLLILVLLPIKANASDVKCTQIEGTNYFTDSKDTKKVLKYIEKAQSYLPEELLKLYEQEGVQIYYLEKSIPEPGMNGQTYKPVCDVDYKDDEKIIRVREPIKIYVFDHPDEYVLIHEYGHALDYIFGYKTGKKACDTAISRSQSWTDLYEMHKNDLKAFRDYGLTNKYEGFAEAFMFSLSDSNFAKKASSLNFYVSKRIQESKKLLEETPNGKSEKVAKR